ncbi:nucleoside recognition domain-containing protein [Methanococcus voltae]|uniref:Nucleoside transporter/FeoB GTPase Gate domain-containing protein n=2 Tax=Methanococcus voltae TaxID=2188 RepID=A0A8J7UT53_METVO|nr:nucleoside recognition domain-containing protein [Methanococcus voltae]MBP2171738.1 hypothetical protein [Methanococcus voltae]MBP2201324.1 hypothetical protein [Methanococcus voltae]MCS3922734.1 hypothetical protein [Methanococcus voltae PS]
MFEFNILDLYESLISSIRYTISISIVVLSSMFIMNYLINTGVMKKLSDFLYPITKNLKMNQLSLYSIITCFFSPTVGYSILAEGLKDNKLTEKELIGSSLANSFPSIFSHIFTFFIPVAIPILGFTGVLYIVLRSGVALIKTVIGLVYLSLVSQSVDFNPKKNEKNKIKDNLKKSWNSTVRFSKRMLPVMFVTMFIVIYFSKLGLFEYLKLLINPFTSVLNLDSNVGLIILTDLVNVQAAMIMGGGFLSGGILNPREVLIGLMFANVLSLSTRYAKHSLPMHISIFGAKLGTKVVMINAVVTFILDIIIIAGLLLWQ